MADFKQHRFNENKVHEQLFGNLFLLSQFYPTSSEFKAIFKKDMFVKNNKAAFFEVVYYLLNILNPELTKQKLTSWPPYDIKRENKFRAEVLKYISELNTLYDSADIPHIMSSHLISPGGLKFTKFMLNLSQLVMCEHLKRTEEDYVLFRPIPSKNTNLANANLINLKKNANSIEQETKKIINDFESFRLDSNEKALFIEDELKKLNDQIREAKERNLLVREEFNKKHPKYPSSAELEGKVHFLKSQYEEIRVIRKLLNECKDLMTYLNSNKVVLEHFRDLRLPDEVLSIVDNQEQLNLANFFQGLNHLLEKKALEFPYPTEQFIHQNSEKVNELTAEYTEIKDNLRKSTMELQCTMEKVSKNIKILVESGKENETDDTLAVPLNDSSKQN